MSRLVGIALLLSGIALNQAATSDEAREYVSAALDLMQQNSMNRDRIDWTTLRRDTLEKAAGALVSADTYDAIRFAAASLGDHHSGLVTPAMLATLNEPATIAASEPTGSLLDHASLTSWSQRS